jgi:preprotein translocase subunit SecE
MLTFAATLRVGKFGTEFGLSAKDIKDPASAGSFCSLSMELTFLCVDAKLDNMKPKRAFKNGNKHMLNKITTYLKETRLEMRKVTWPTRQQTVRFTIIVIVVSVGVSLVLGGFDFIFHELIKRVI